MYGRELYSTPSDCLYTTLYYRTNLMCPLKQLQALKAYKSPPDAECTFDMPRNVKQLQLSHNFPKIKSIQKLSIISALTSTCAYPNVLPRDRNYGFSYGALMKSFPDKLTLGIGKFTLPQVFPQLSIPFSMLFGLPLDHERVAMYICTLNHNFIAKHLRLLSQYL